MEIDTRYINQIEVIINLFTMDKSKLRVLLIKRDIEPYKGYWMLPSNLLMTSETIPSCASDTALEFIGISDIDFKQCNVFSQIDRLPNDRIVANSLIGIVDKETLKLKRKNTSYEGVWFPIDEIPKMVFDHADILNDAILYLKSQLNNTEMLKKLFPSDFTMSELQNLYEQILDKKLDRRNFRKKIINLVENTEEKINNTNGRPATLYRFKDENIENLF